ncbi:serralysin [Roseivivax halotolerans]|uniref:Serralysin n=2 Tax=Roseivivax halotolerans TaxID=93684 RepID=A0A1I6A395_9RHOB|nr:serralysin [Roseivivax halotolerans]
MCIYCDKAGLMNGNQTGATTLPDPSVAVTTDYTDAIDWGTQISSGQTNADGDMVIEYYFAVPGERFGFFQSQEWSEYEKGQAEIAFQTFEDIIDVEFVEVDNAEDAELVLNKVDARGLYLGVFNPPGTLNEGSGGFNSEGTGWNETGGLEQGGYGFITLIHELGHGLGLAHPHDTGGGSPILPGVFNSGSTGVDDLNQGVYTMMSYIDGWVTNPDGDVTPLDTVNYGYQGTPMAVDIAVLQDKYGANMDHATGDDVYMLPDANGSGTFYACIWDAGGTDELRYDGSENAVLDLRPATLELEEGGGGWISYVEGIYGGYTIANGVVIENATGGSGNDAIIANAADNVLTGGAGDDTFIFVEGQGGYDVITDWGNGDDQLDLSDYGRIGLRNFSFDRTPEGFELSFFDQTILFEGVGASTTASEADYLLA